MNLSNTTWVFAERIASSLLNLLCIIAIARLLGPQAYGEYAYVISMTGIVLATGQLGLDGLLMKKVIDRKEPIADLLGSVSIMKYLVYLPVSALFVLYGFWNPEHSVSEQYLILFSVLILLSSPLTTTIMAWLNANELFKTASAARIFAIFAGTAIKLTLIFTGMGVVSVGLVNSLTFVLEAALLLAVFQLAKGTPLRSWKPRRLTMQRLFKESSLLFAGTLLAILYFNVDMLMIRFMLGQRSVGEYALVPQILQSLQILPYAITLVSFPALLKMVESKSEDFALVCAKQYLLLIGLATVVATGLALCAPLIMPLIFGPEYGATVPILQMACFALPLLFIRQLHTKLFIAFELGHILVKVEALGLATNVALNFWLIPQLGGYGAAISTVAALFLSTVIAVLMFPETRRIVAMIFGRKSWENAR